jgi:hypothetical protein
MDHAKLFWHDVRFQATKTDLLLDLGSRDACDPVIDRIKLVYTTKLNHLGARWRAPKESTPAFMSGTDVTIVE